MQTESRPKSNNSVMHQQQHRHAPSLLTTMSSMFWLKTFSRQGQIPDDTEDGLGLGIRMSLLARIARVGSNVLLKSRN